MTFIGFPKVKWLHLTGEVDKSVRCSCQIFSVSCVLCPKKRPPFYFLNNSVKIEPILKIGMLNPQKIWQEEWKDFFKHDGEEKRGGEWGEYIWTFDEGWKSGRESIKIKYKEGTYRWERMGMGRKRGLWKSSSRGSWCIKTRGWTNRGYMHHCAKFHQNQSNGCWDMAI